MKCGVGLCGHCQLGPLLDLPRRAGLQLRRERAAVRGGAVTAELRAAPRPKLAVWKFASCDGCQLIAARLRGRAARARRRGRASPTSSRPRARSVAGPYDLSLVEGSITTAARRRAHPGGAPHVAASWSRSAPARPRAASRRCATSPTCGSSRSVVYASPRVHLARSSTSTPIAAHVPVDFELRGCPINKRQLLEVISAFLHGRRPAIPAHSVCIECKRRGNVCVMVAHGTPCLGPVTHAGLRRALPRLRARLLRLLRPDGDARTPARSARGWRELGLDDARRAARLFRTFNAAAAPFRERRARPWLSVRTIKIDYLARVEGEGALQRRARDGRVERRRAAHLRAAALLRGAAARARLHRGARHHRAHLRHLPGRLPDERGATRSSSLPASR